jgi:polyvinyl alcohol dehydrogenase (cytochrome)
MKPARPAYTLMATLAAAFLAGQSQAQTPAQSGNPTVRGHGNELYLKTCATCHDHAEDRTPPRSVLQNLSPDTVAEALTTGAMKPMASGLSQSDIADIAFYLTSKMPSAPKDDGALANMCPKADPIDMSKPSWNGWSPDGANTRFQPNPGLKATDIPKLKVKWTFAYRGSKNSQVTVVGDRLFLGSSAGLLYSLNAKTGCTYWRYEPAAGMRAAPVVFKLATAPSGYAVIVNDYNLHVNALDAVSGKPLWSTEVENHPRSVLTGAPKVYNGVVYVPVSSVEEVSVSAPGYICCTFRGSVVALDATSGKQRWRTYTIPEIPHTYRSGQPQLGPAGAAVWSSPTLDPKRGLLYITTGDSYTDVQADAADAVMALDLKTGAVKWSTQVTTKDNFVGGCPRTGVLPANCPTPMGPDHDFGAPPILQTLPNGKDIILAGQKSSEAYGLDPDARGKLIWRVKLGRGGAAGGVEWGMASDKDNVYVALADAGAGGSPGISALKIASGEVVWKVPTPKTDCAPPRRCVQSQSAPVSAIPGAVLSGAQDGHLRAYDAKTGAIIWDFDTTAEAYNTVNGVKGAKGGVLDATGPTFAGGMMFQHSGYPGVMATAGSGENLLIAFSVDGR